MNAIPYDLYIQMDVLKRLWAEETCRNTQILQCGFTSIELTMRLLASEMRKRRPYQKKKEMICYILQGIETQLNLLNSFKYAPDFEREDLFAKDTYYSRNLSSLNKLDSRYRYVIDRITDKYFRLSGKLGVDIGLGTQVNNIRAALCLRPLNYIFRRKLAYSQLIKPTEISNLENPAYYNTEDELFMTVHQISECWFRLAIEELSELLRILEEGQNLTVKNSKYLKHVSDILQYTSSHILMLENMELVDYHPLRVALRGASGGQSQQAYKVFTMAKKVFRAFIGKLTQENLSVLKVLEAPHKFEHFDALIHGFTKLERSLKNFFFQHYMLSSSVIGSESFGSIGKDLIVLTKKFTEPIFKEIDEAKYAFTLKTNFQYGKDAGKLILRKEDFQPIEDQNHRIESARLNEVIDNYFNAIKRLDSDAWVKLFAGNGYIEDPKGSRPYIGHKELSVFFKGIKRTFTSFNMTIEHKEIYSNSAQVQWSAQATAYNQKELAFRGKEVFHISPQGEILAAQVHWNPAVVAAQL